MQEEHVNMQDIRNNMEIRSIRTKIEKRTLERLGHVMRMEDNRHVKIAVLGWVEDLERFEKRPGRKRKTVLYWKRLMKEAGLDTTRVNQLTKDRKEWKRMVNERVKHLDEWESKAGNRTMGERGERNKLPDNENLTCDVEGCGKTCKSKAGLTNHRRRMHEKSKEKVRFECQRCKEIFEYESNLVNHAKICTGMSAVDPDNRRCDICSKELRKSNYSRHFKACKAKQDSQLGIIPEGPQIPARVHTGKRVTCEICGLEQSAGNLSRHKKIHDRENIQ